MQITIKGTIIPLTPAIESYVHKKIGALEKFLKQFKPATVEARVEVGKTTEHHHKGNVFRAEVNLHLPKQLLRAEYSAGDLYAAIDLVHDELKRQIIARKNKLVKRRTHTGSDRKGVVE
ncbi:MAG: ribosome-associated translation inhibitor RaiA [Candidatus Magasanikbacteria bacterium]|nr:ribosome-associated translation inhibitor RaiA [Candidatus Magasanikbacteria bacterium]